MIRVGPAGWSYADWEGTVYPRRRPKGFHALPYLARFVDCIEINSSFYATPQARNAERWVSLVADRPDFRFLVKLEKFFTHEPLPADRGALEERTAGFLEGIEPLQRSAKLSALLVQFPLSFRKRGASEERLEIIEGLFGHLPLVLEVRHRSWFKGPALERIGALGYSMAEIDLPAGPDHPPPDPPRVGPIGYLRLHGRNAESWFDPRAGRDRRYDYLYSPDEIAELARVARKLASGHGETFVITNNHFGGQAVANALELMVALGGSAPSAPVELLQAFPRLRETIRAHGQDTLF